MKIEPLASCTKVSLAQQPRRLRLHNYSTRPLIPQARQAIFEKSMRLRGMSELQGTIYPHLVLPLNYGSFSQRYNGLGLQKKNTHNLQLLQNFAARISTSTKKNSSYISRILNELGWFSIYELRNWCDPSIIHKCINSLLQPISYSFQTF